MIKIAINGETGMREVSFSRENKHVITLIGDVPEAIDGFCTYRQNGQPLGVFTGYNTVYRKVDGGVQLSDDGSVYAEPEAVEVPELVETLTQEERIAQLEEQNATLLECLLEMSEIVYA